MRHCIIISCISLMAICSLACHDAEARKIRTKLPDKYSSSSVYADTSSDTIPQIIITDSLCEANHLDIKRRVRFYGFDKTINSTKESFFIVNHLDSILHRVAVEISYFDSKRRLLHKREVELECNVPPRETRRVDIKTWDTQKAFYFKKSAKPQRQATPFDVTIRLKGAVLLPSEQTIVD